MPSKPLRFRTAAARPQAGLPRPRETRTPRFDDRLSSTQRGYDAAWRKLRAQFANRQPLCRACECLGRTSPLDEVDHTLPFEGRDDLLRLLLANLMGLCAMHHRLKTRLDESSQIAQYKQDFRAAQSEAGQLEILQAAQAYVLAEITFGVSL